ncbi:GNAT family N-acetyltransferase [Falsirhodobacter algicola]|uniref:GNAT family N-acetyltransferase n=1 Tax=Falsirhodobacter algicola TaxID=2692330 RepID=A0A8J8MV54_9RHOB|nr:GNAT family N-acetyltransferase [Falsirhodobacter algicola]QUS37265.1 GNAT family N-acetyltransferase [Falsirhodobacter algicola]
MTKAHIRLATPADLPRIYEICLLTAGAGGDGTHLYSDPKGPGYMHAAPYAVLEPECAFVLDDGTGRAVGYIVGTPDTAAFEDRLDAEWWPDVRAAIAEMPVACDKDAVLIERAKGGHRRDPSLLASYPAHLHINILPPAQGGGWGRRMIQTQLDAMRARGVTGLHLGLDPRNVTAIAFYTHLGFRDVSVDSDLVYGMDLRTPA